jgi:hypothetical protein
VVLAVVSLGFYSIVSSEIKPQHQEKQANTHQDENQSIEMASSTRSIIARKLSQDSASQPASIIEDNGGELTDEYVAHMNKIVRQVLGCLCTIITGFCFGVSYNPVIHTSERDKNPNYFDYYLSFYTGSMATSLLFFVVYCAVKRNKPIVYPNLILPGLASGKI